MNMSLIDVLWFTPMKKLSGGHRFIQDTRMGYCLAAAGTMIKQ